MALSVATILLASESASAQSASPNDGWALDRFEPAPTGDVFFFAEHPWYSSTRLFAVGLTLEHAVNPLVFRELNADGSTTTTTVVSAMLSGHVGAMVSFADRVGVGLSLPVSLSQSGTNLSDGPVTLGPASGLAPGDLRANLRVRLFGHADHDAISVHVGAHLWVPTGQSAQNTSDDRVRVEPRITVAGRAAVLRWSVTLGYQFRPDYVTASVALASELRATAALGVVLLGDRLTAGPEAYVVTTLSDPSGQRSGPFADGLWGAEAIVSAHYLIADTLLAGVGGGVGLASGYGIPTGRAMVSLAYAPVRHAPTPPVRPLDSDADGLADADDRCPNTPRGPHPDPMHAGCPEADTDGDGVFDTGDRCASEAQGTHPDPARPGCPLRDHDEDGLLDPDDPCPEVPQGLTPDPARAGCPAGDRDHDGVVDPEDQCPDVSGASLPDPEREGCPMPDADHDLVTDAVDACPAEAGVESSDPSRNGCPVDFEAPRRGRHRGGHPSRERHGHHREGRHHRAR